MAAAHQRNAALLMSDKDSVANDSDLGYCSGALAVDAAFQGHRQIMPLVYQSRLVGAEETLVLWAGGNNSVDSQSIDLLGHAIDVMFIKSSGSDMKTIVPKEFPAVRLDYIAPLRSREGDMSDQEMV